VREQSTQQLPLEGCVGLIGAPLLHHLRYRLPERRN
jgi:hypothetical protein